MTVKGEPRRLAASALTVGGHAFAWARLRTRERLRLSPSHQEWERDWDSGQAENANPASTAGDGCSVPPAEVDDERPVGPCFAGAGVAAIGLPGVHGALHAASVLTAVCGLFPPANVSCLGLLACADAANPHSARRRWLRFASGIVPVRSIGLAVTSYDSRI
ncbi:hypothetical protein GGI42DRAFT_5929 [Trichoderma sp. SZMC 28013]